MLHERHDQTLFVVLECVEFHESMSGENIAIASFSKCQHIIYAWGGFFLRSWFDRSVVVISLLFQLTIKLPFLSSTEILPLMDGLTKWPFFLSSSLQTDSLISMLICSTSGATARWMNFYNKYGNAHFLRWHQLHRNDMKISLFHPYWTEILDVQ